MRFTNVFVDLEVLLDATPLSLRSFEPSPGDSPFSVVLFLLYDGSPRLAAGQPVIPTIHRRVRATRWISGIRCLLPLIGILAHFPGENLSGKCRLNYHPPMYQPGHLEDVRAEDYGHQAGLENSQGGRYRPDKPVTQPPPLETIPLIISGPTTNRVDLVFFSDGCE